jgi:hypothetical protein
LFPLRRSGHDNAAGNALVAESGVEAAPKQRLTGGKAPRFLISLHASFRKQEISDRFVAFAGQGSKVPDERPKRARLFQEKKQTSSAAGARLARASRSWHRHCSRRSHSRLSSCVLFVFRQSQINID